MRRPSLIVAASALTLLTAVAAQAQEPLQLGQTITGDLMGAAPGDDDVYTLSLAAGQRVLIEVRSDAFDTYIEVRRVADDEVLAADDDGMGEGVNSRLRFSAVEAGDYALFVRSVNDQTGEYSLSARALPPASPAPRPGQIRSGRQVLGELTDRDPETATGAPYDAYVWRAREGERRVITLTSEAFDPVVQVGRQDDSRGFDELAVNDDDGDGGVNSRLVFTTPDAGDYVIRVTSLRSDGRGDYRLMLADAPPAPPARAIEIGGSVGGRLEGEPALHTFRARAGQRVRVGLSSADFDTVVALLDADQNSLAEDDDGAGDGTNSQLTQTLDRDGDYYVQVKAFGDTATGTYRLTIDEVAPDPAATPIPFGQTVQGEITEDAAEDGEGRGFVDYAFSGRQGQRVQAIMRSGDFDTYLQVGKAGGEFAVLGQDDDGLGEGTDSRLNFALPEDGDYVLRASPLGADEQGLFSLELIDRGPQPTAGSLLVGSTARGTLTETDATANDNSFYDAYRVTLQEGDKLRVTMVSNDVDSFVVIGGVEGDVFEQLAADDDGLSDTHAKLEWIAPSTGEYEIRAGTFQQGQTGAYALNVEKRN